MEVININGLYLQPFLM